MTSSPGLRDGLRRLSSGLIAYGVVSLVVAAIGLGAVVWVNDRVGTLRNEAEATLIQESAAMEIAAGVLHDASTTAGSFAVTVDQASRAVSTSAGTMAEVRKDLAALEGQLRSVNILGATPLSSSADAVDRIAESTVGLDTRLLLIADTLQGDRAALAADATSLDELADSAEALAAHLGSGVVDDTLGETQRIVSFTLLLLATWSVMPGVGALALGIWLRRRLGASRSR